MNGVATSPAAASPITVFGADWCEDTRRTLRLLRRLSLGHRYRNVDEDVEALNRALQLNHGVRRTPVVDVGGEVLVEPSNTALATLLIGRELISREDIITRMRLQNVGDAERAMRVGVGLALLGGATFAGGTWRGPLRLLGAGLLLTGMAGWCPVYRARLWTSLGGPGDRPDEAERSTWIKQLGIKPLEPAGQRRAADAPDGERRETDPSDPSVPDTPETPGPHD